MDYSLVSLLSVGFGVDSKREDMVVVFCLSSNAKQTHRVGVPFYQDSELIVSE